MDKEDWKIVGIALLIAVPLCLLNGIVAGVVYWLITSA